jgi:ADP-dependent NAD(P)H-hydrate dehydratase
MPIEIVTTLPRLPIRPTDAHKGMFGQVLVVAGSRGMSGAAVLCGSAALRGGAGTVQVASPAAIQPTVAAGQLCFTTAALADSETGQVTNTALPAVLKLATHASVLAIGPGLGSGDQVRWVVHGLLEQSELPAVLDADGINSFAPLSDGQQIRAGKPTILTPHPGEFARLMNTTTATVQADRQIWAVRFAIEQRQILVLKGANTLVTDGNRLYVNRTGNPGMATGGCGDVLTGLIAALVAQGLEPFAAAQLGVYLHGFAGDLACGELGEESLIASDLLDYLPKAFVRYRAS